MIKRIHRELGITMLYVTHDQEEALTMSDRIILLNAGRVEQDGLPADLYHRPNSAFVANFVGHSNLLSGCVEELGPPARIRTRGGRVFATKEPAGVPVGREVSLMVRPENVVIVSTADRGAFQENAIDGIVVDSIVLGCVIRHHVETGEGRRFVSVELNRPGLRALDKGTPVVLGWRAVDMRILSNVADASG